MPETEITKSWPWVAARLGIYFLAILIFAFGFYVLHGVLGVAYEGVSIGIGILFALPACLSALLAFVLDLNGLRPKKFYRLVPLFLLGGILVLGGLIFKEGLVCIVMLAPLWLISAYIGSIMVYSFQNKFRERHQTDVFKCSVLVLIPFLALYFDANLPQNSREYVVTRSVVIERPVGDIWPHLLEMENIQPSEGRWNMAQDVFAIARPRQAVVEGSGVGTKRLARWDGNISFEEHITDWVPNERLQWKFVFPNDSIQTHTDRHISPDGAHLKIMDGGYELRVITPQRTELILHTRYKTKTAVNGYSSVWGQLFLGGIQNNVLHIVKDRAELSPP